MLCEIATNYGYFVLWIVMTVLAFISVLILSGSLFYPYYVKPTFEKWQYKNNPKFPTPQMVKKEIIQMCKGLAAATLCPAFALMASKWGVSQGYCGENDKAFSLFTQTVIIFFFTDFAEYAYHWVGHRFNLFWNIHRFHHMFYNPSPFSVIADEYVDQFVRTMPMVILPTLLPINMDLLFAVFAILFYGYGVYLHWGYETPYLNAHNPIFNTAYHHYLHHAISGKGRPIYTGFFFKLWDQLFNSGNPGACQCYSCRPKRTLQEWNELEKHDYSVLLSPKWWLTSNNNKKVVSKDG